MTDWCVGDLAVCVDARRSNLVDGRIYTVSAYFFDPGLNDLGGFSDYTLRFLEVQPLMGRTGYCETRFRKIRPDTHEACEAEFVTLLKRTKRKVEA